MAEFTTSLTVEADSIRQEEREALRRLARHVAAQAARAAGYKDAAEVSINFIEMVLTEAINARDAELDRLRQGGDRSVSS